MNDDRHDMSWYHWRDATEFERSWFDVLWLAKRWKAIRRRRESEIGCCCLPVTQPPFDWRYEYDCLRHMVVDLCPEYMSMQ
jgi:hypothetical protein